jgi:hypothetical protein
MIKLIEALAGLVLLCSCATGVLPTTAPTKTYELMLSGTIDGAAFQGIGVGSNTTSHQMTISSSIAVNYFTMESCHRSTQAGNVIPANPWYDWSTDSKSFSFAYNQAPTIEDSGECILRFCAYSNTVGSPPVACAVVDFKNAYYALDYENICNGADGNTTGGGTALCHSQVGLIERVRFPVPVMVAPEVTDPTGGTAPYWINGQCQGQFLDSQQTLFQYTVPATECSVRFLELAKPHRKAKLTVIPYTDALYLGG